MTQPDLSALSAWFAGPKAENGDWFADSLARILDDYYAWRRNYFPEDAVVVNSAMRRAEEDFRDRFDDRLIELLARLKADFPFQSPRYAAHMVAEQALPAIAGYFAAMLYNPNNVSTEAAPVTVRLELEAARLISRMLGYGDESWSHLTSGGTNANFEALWIARSVKYLPLLCADAAASLGLSDPIRAETWPTLLAQDPPRALRNFARFLRDASRAVADRPSGPALLADAIRTSRWNVAERGMAGVLRDLGSDPVILVPETRHYCFEKAADLLGLGRSCLQVVPVDQDFRMCPDALADILDRVEAQGRHVLAAVVVVGTTEEGAVDPVDRVLQLRSAREAQGKPSFWLHADAAYGGYLRTITLPSRSGLGEPTTISRIRGTDVTLPLNLPHGSACSALERLGECDSITIDPHKLGYVPYPAGAVCFKSRDVRLVARQEAPYIAETASHSPESPPEGIGMYILEGSKPGAAAAAVWLSHTLIPLDATGHGMLVRETIRNACELHSLLGEIPRRCPELRVRAEPLCLPGSNILCYAFRDAGRSRPLDELNRLNRGVYDRFTLRAGERVYDQSFFVSRTTLDFARYAPRAVDSFLERLGADERQYARHGVFLLRSVLMNPWYSLAKQRGRHYVAELAAELYRVADQLFAGD